MPTSSFPKPTFPFAFDVETESGHLRKWKAHGGVPAKKAGQVLVATWNIANFGAQQSEDRHLQLIAGIISWFDVVAVQEVRENFWHLDDIVRILGTPYRMRFSDSSGNNQRMAFVCDAKKLTLLG